MEKNHEKATSADQTPLPRSGQAEKQHTANLCRGYQLVICSSPLRVTMEAPVEDGHPSCRRLATVNDTGWFRAFDPSPSK